MSTDLDNHNGDYHSPRVISLTLVVITHLEPDLLKCEVRWALGSITMNKDSGGDGIPGR